MDERPHLISADALEKRLGEPGLSIVDAAWYLPVHKRDARAEYEAAHIPHAVFFDHDRVVEPDTGLPHSLPNEKLFAQFAGSMGIAATDTVVVYDGPGLFSAPRAWWMFRTMGVEKVLILDGGFDRWKSEGRPTTAELPRIAPCLFEPRFDEDRVASLAEMRGVVAGGSAQVVDARPAGRFTGDEPEPRPGMRAGHMPGARNLPAANLSENGSLLPPEKLEAAFEEAGVDLDRPIVSSCGSGITAAIVTLALESLGKRDAKLYDGSWAEWSTQGDTEAVTGPAETRA